MKKAVTVVSLLTLALSANAGTQFFHEISDVFGRDMAAPGPLASLGHLAIGFGTIASGDVANGGTMNVIEVLNEAKTIQVNTISNFKSRSPYWGAKYGITNPDYPFAKLLDAKKEMLNGCSTYTTNTEAWPTHMDGNKRICGQFRCDTFVQWILSNESDTRIKNLILITPTKVFNTHPFFREHGTKFTEFDKKTDTTKVPMRIDIIDSIDAATFITMTIQELDAMMRQVKESKSAAASTVKLWSLYKSGIVTEGYKEYALDSLTLYADANFIPLYIESYHAADSKSEKNFILKDLQSLRQKVLNADDIEYKNMLNEFYLSLIDDNKAQGYDFIVRGFIETSDKFSADMSATLFDKIKQSDLPMMNKTNLYWDLSMKSDAQLKVIQDYYQEIKDSADSDDREAFLGRYELTKTQLNVESRDYLKSIGNKQPVD